MKIAFIEINNKYDLQFELPMAYKQLKSYLLKYSKYKNDIEMTCFKNIQCIPEDADIIAVSSTSQNFFDTIRFIKHIRELFPEKLAILGGHHISNLPETLPEEFDLGVMFEGELTFLQLVDKYIETNKDKKSLFTLKGIVYHNEKNEIVINELNKLIEPLDSIPFPILEGTEPPYIFSSRGCPYRCSFCSSTQFWKKTRFFSHNYVISQIEFIIENFPDHKLITFWDDLFIADRERFKKIVYEINKRGLNTKVQFCIAVRANLVDDEICQLIKKMNVKVVSFGAESGCNRILQILKGNNVSVDTNQRAINALKKWGIPTVCSFIIGNPTETKEEVKETFDFIQYNKKENGIEPTINILMPLPGTKMWDYAIKNNIIKQPVNWNRLKLFASFKTSQLDKFDTWMEERLNNNTYYINDDYIPHKELLEMLKEFELSLEVTNLRKERRIKKFFGSIFKPFAGKF